MASERIQAIRGMNDVLPDESHLWEFFESTAREVLRLCGYRAIRMPIVERTELFVRSIGEATDIVEKEMYSFQDSLSGENLTLRPEGTASCVRAVVEHSLLYKGPQRLWYSGPMFRHERPQKGRYRQFHQIGVEAFGLAGPDVDAEQIVMCARLWRNLGLTGIALQLNTLGSPAARQRYREELVKYFQGHGERLDADSTRRLKTNPLRILDSKNPEMQQLIQGAPRLMDYLDAGSLEHFDGLKKYLGLSGVTFDLNTRLVRGLDYYNNTVFEWVTGELGAQGAICAGGRYDGLVRELGGASTPACGFAIGVERVIELLKLRPQGIEESAVDVYVVRQGPRADGFSWLVGEQLRSAGLSVTVHCGGGSMSSQMKRAAASGARYAAIIGDNEAVARQLTLKDLGTGVQKLLAVEQAIEEVMGGSPHRSPITDHQSRS
jgi:histidyl-tRNA synthetase